MTDLNRKIDELLEEKLRATKEKTSADFTSMLIKRVIEERNSVVSEAKSDRIAKFIVWGFIAATIAVLFITAYSVSPSSVTGSEPKSFRISPGIETTTDLFTDITVYIQSVTESVLSLFGLSLTAKTIMYVLGFLGLICLYLLGDRLIVRSRLKSNQV